ncbi:MAG TPA: DinB family protein [Nitrososphaerales archaeon]|nr:DinB family protein [Nitrososphaerales archaeon]
MSKSRNPPNEVVLARAWCDWSTRSMGEYLEAILRLPAKERKKDRGASWGSIQNIYLHMVEDYIWWFENVPQGRFDESDSVDLVGKSLSDEEMRKLEKRVARSVGRVMKSATPESLWRPMEVRGIGGNGKPYKFTTCLSDIIWHMVEEELQHRGELNALFWQMDVDPPLRSWFSSRLAYAK